MEEEIQEILSNVEQPAIDEAHIEVPNEKLSDEIVSSPVKIEVDKPKFQIEEIEKEEPEQKHHQYLHRLDEFIKTLSTHQCQSCKKTFVYGDWQEVGKNGKKRSHFIATRPSRKGIEHKTHQMLEGDQAPENYFERWEQDTIELEKLVKEGKNQSEIAEIMGRTENSISNMISKHGLREMYVLTQRNGGKNEYIIF